MLIITCQILLLACAILFFKNEIASSELLSLIAYFSLLAGVITELIVLFHKRGI
jgi:hypothetical protein